ncbi:hypothetical protein SAMN05421763_1011042 [[Luteovulum] sphaeroides subsp. megalophilum]|nr:hypothetical protein SAMN05421763_1011042 [[Luteovulum] sphaeroides subsp. megalophilum]
MVIGTAGGGAVPNSGGRGRAARSRKGATAPGRRREPPLGHRHRGRRCSAEFRWEGARGPIPKGGDGSREEEGAAAWSSAPREEVQCRSPEGGGTWPDPGRGATAPGRRREPPLGHRHRGRRCSAEVRWEGARGPIPEGEAAAPGRRREPPLGHRHRGRRCSAEVQWAGGARPDARIWCSDPREEEGAAAVPIGQGGGEAVRRGGSLRFGRKDGDTREEERRRRCCYRSREEVGPRRKLRDRRRLPSRCG